MPTPSPSPGSRITISGATDHRPSVSARVPQRTRALTEPAMIHDHNFAPGNTGYVFWFDVLAPVLLIVLYVATG
jgi:hypothetical protein